MTTNETTANEIGETYDVSFSRAAGDRLWKSSGWLERADARKLAAELAASGFDVTIEPLDDGQFDLFVDLW